MKKWIVLSDYGLDDAAALIYMLQKCEFDALDIVCVAGNTSAYHSLVNCKKLLAAFFSESDFDAKKITLVDTTDIEQEFSVLPDVHGGDGMGDIIADGGEQLGAIKFADYLKGLQHGQVAQVISLGPAALTKPIMQIVGDVPLLLMGHMVNEKPNFRGGEFNYVLAKSEFDYCSALSNSVVATLDTCRTEPFNLAFYAPPKNGLLNKLIARAIELAVSRHPDNCYVYDLIACVYLVHPDAFLKQRVAAEGGMITNLVLKNK